MGQHKCLKFICTYLLVLVCYLTLPYLAWWLVGWLVDWVTGLPACLLAGWLLVEWMDEWMNDCSALQGKKETLWTKTTAREWERERREFSSTTFGYRAAAYKHRVHACMLFSCVVHTPLHHIIGGMAAVQQRGGSSRQPAIHPSIHWTVIRHPIQPITHQQSNHCKSKTNAAEKIYFKLLTESYYHISPTWCIECIKLPSLKGAAASQIQSVN